MKELTGLYDQLLCPEDDFLDGLKEDAFKAGLGIKTGITLTSRDAEGGFHDFPLYVPKYAVTGICARTGGGKTTLMTNLAVRMSMSDAFGLFVTLEEPAFSITAKMLAAYSSWKNPNHSLEGLTNSEALKVIAQKATHKDLEGFRKAVLSRCRTVDANGLADREDIESATVLYNPQYITDLINYRDSRSSRKLDYVLIDFGQLLESSVDNSNSYQRMKGVMMALKNLAGSGVAVVAGFQMKREVIGFNIWDWEPEQIRDGSDAEQACSMLIAVGRDTDKDYQGDERDVIRLMKNRNGAKRVGGRMIIDFARNAVPSMTSQPTGDEL